MPYTRSGILSLFIAGSPDGHRAALAIVVLRAIFAATGPVAAQQATPADGDSSLTERTAGAIESNVGSGIDWLRERRTFVMNGIPYGLTGLPIILYKPSGEFHYGGWIEILNYESRPYKYRLNIQWWLSTRGKRQHYIRFDFPSFFGIADNVRFLTQDARNPRASFYGLGNRTTIDGDSLAVNPDYYTYQFEQQRTSIDVERAVSGPLVFYAGIRLARNIPSRVDQTKDTYFLFSRADLPGVSAGWTNSVVAGFILDTRDDRALPSRGTLSEISVRKGLRGLGADYPFRQLTIIHTQYFHPASRHVIVMRFIAENLSSETPFYILSEVGGSLRASEVVGGDFLRGYESRRFADRQKALFTLEVRRNLPGRRMIGQFVQTQIIGFADFGRFAPTLGEFGLRNIHASGGGGFQAIVNRQLGLRGDLGFSREGHRFILSFGNQF